MTKAALKRLWIVLFAIPIVFVPFVCLAHPGGTDASGGHYDRSTGEYHYHHGYPAHQHVNGVCPYENSTQTPYPKFDSPTGETTNKNESEELNDKKADEKDRNGTISQNQETNDQDNKKLTLGDVLSFILISIASIFVAFELFVIFNGVANELYSLMFRKTMKREDLLDQKCQDLIFKLNDFQQIKNVEYSILWPRLHKEFKLAYIDALDRKYGLSNNTCFEENLIPNGVQIDNSGFPHWEEYMDRPLSDVAFSFRLNANTMVYHTVWCKVGKGMIVNAADLITYSVVPCKVCRPKLPSLSWLFQYRKIIYARYLLISRSDFI